MFDTSDWLLEQRGFLPVPVVITEPAVGFGAGAALLFFHKSESQVRIDEDTKPEELLPPSISGVLGLGTENGTWAAGGFHWASWKQDRIRYLGALIRPSVNLTFYGRGNLPFGGLDYNLEGWATDHKLKFRLPDTNLFLGGEVVYFDSTSRQYEQVRP
jgi:hypothetical protein